MASPTEPKSIQVSSAISAEDLKSKRDLWNAFYRAEEQFLLWINSHCEILLDIHASSPMFDQNMKSVSFGYDYSINNRGKVTCKSPRFIRKCISFASDELFNECQSRATVVNELYMCAAMFLNSKAVRLPQRSPVFYSNVMQINHSNDNAFGSQLIKTDGTFTLYSGVNDDKIRHTITSAFLDSGFKTVQVDVDSLGLSMVINVNMIEIRDYFGCSDDMTLRSRRSTGTQYTARITFCDQQRAVRSKFGFMVLNADSRPSFYESPPRKKRSDTIELKSEEVFLPVELSRRFFITQG